MFQMKLLIYLYWLKGGTLPYLYLSALGIQCEKPPAVVADAPRVSGVRLSMDVRGNGVRFTASDEKMCHPTCYESSREIWVQAETWRKGKYC